MTCVIFMEGNVPSLKNSKQWTGKHLIASKTVRNYLKEHEWQWVVPDLFLEEVKKRKLEYPLRIGFYFIRDSKRKFDYINAAQLPLDLMVKHGWIPDDDCHHVIPVFKGFEVNKARAGVLISL